ncbi:Tat pathway signal sequence domain protein [Streptomyces sporangiiformans]|uniref:Tat pathway signal sequence domain protein n=1 Tax=Streptomyces sporangiiformans TaxID=2315329 RepID=A0A505DHM8_9ACTN|nr:Tat pathway signal sequence domain protein [Streptomyces sporangiiformans]TPQ18686.1 Tat pathway signal sequence domain protein [Streptomyces sporangiiformans]
MSGVGPVEPGEGTRAWDTLEPGDPLAPEPPRGRLAQLYARHRRAVLASVSAAALLAGGGYLYTSRPQDPPPTPPPYPSNVVDVAYLGRQPTPQDAAPKSFSIAVELTTHSGPTVTVTRITQPYASLSLTSDPRLPFRTRTGFPHKILITLHVTDCSHVPTNARLPFLDVTLRNTRAIQVHSFILGDRYARDLSKAIQDACDNGSTS